MKVGLPSTRLRNLWLGWCLVLLAGFSSGCFAPKLPPISLQAEGWHSQEIPAVWQRSSKAPEIAGELLVASHSNGARYIQFSKGGLPILTARESTEGWSIRSSLRRGVFGGHGHPPGSILWFQVPSLPRTNAVAVKSPWQIESSDGGGWILRHPRTGERLEGLGSP
jgi:hypothetical protein